MRLRSGPDKALLQSGRISALAGRQGRLRACIQIFQRCYSQQLKTLVTSSIIKSDGVPRPSAGGGLAFQCWGGAAKFQMSAIVVFGDNNSDVVTTGINGARRVAMGAT